MKKLLKIPIILLFAVFLFGSNVYGLPMVEFADSPFAVVNGKSTETVENVYGDLDIIFTASVGALTYNPGPGGGVDGIGIKDDEISLNQVLFVGLSEALNLSKLYLTDLFYEGNPRYQEIGRYRFNGGAWKQFSASTDQEPGSSNGEFIINPDPTLLISAIEFEAIDSTRNDFSVRGMDIVSAPEPATMMMLGTGLLGIAAFGRKNY
jgi:hypothetical protein